MTEQPALHPEHERLKALVSCCQKRVSRANEKLQAASTEQFEALDALDAAAARLALWISQNPDPQRSIFEELVNV